MCNTTGVQTFWGKPLSQSNKTTMIMKIVYLSGYYLAHSEMPAVLKNAGTIVACIPPPLSLSLSLSLSRRHTNSMQTCYFTQVIHFLIPTTTAPNYDHALTSNYFLPTLSPPPFSIPYFRTPFHYSHIYLSPVFVDRHVFHPLVCNPFAIPLSIVLKEIIRSAALQAI